MSLLSDDQSFTFECESCGHQREVTILELRSAPQLVCASCGAIDPHDVQVLLSEVEKDLTPPEGARRKLDETPD